MKTQEIVTGLIEGAKKIAKREAQRFSEGASFGDRVRQGDVFLTLLARVPAGAGKMKAVPTQLAPGTTQGSRHTLDSTEGVTAYLRDGATEFEGPVLKLLKERIIDHPEHGAWCLPPGIYGVTYQRTQDALDRARRVAD